MNKSSKLSLAVVTAMSLMFSAGGAFADNKGDSMVNFPKDDSTIVDAAGANADSTDVWFVKDDTAIGYTIQLINVSGSETAVGDNALVTNAATATGCNTAIAAATSEEVVVSTFMKASDLSCDDESLASLAIGDAITGSFKVCKWTTPVLAAGSYALGVSSIHAGDNIDTYVETIGGTTVCGNDAAAHGDNDAADGTEAKDSHYQTFAVKAATTSSSVTQAPNIPVQVSPAAGTEYTGEAGSDSLVFKDYSPAEGEASWYELWIYDPSGARVQIGAPTAHTGANNWFKVKVDATVVCGASDTPFTPADTTTVPAGPDAQGSFRTCEIQLDDDMDLAVQTTAGEGTFRWYVQGYNAVGGRSGWSPAATFINDADD